MACRRKYVVLDCSDFHNLLIGTCILEIECLESLYPSKLFCRQDQEMIMTLLCDCDASSSDSSSSEEDDLELLLFNVLETSERFVGPRINLEDLTCRECEQMFRFVISLL